MALVVLLQLVDAPIVKQVASFSQGRHMLKSVFEAVSGRGQGTSHSPLKMCVCASCCPRIPWCLLLPRSSALQTAMSVVAHHRAAVKGWAGGSSDSNSSSSLRQPPLGQTYYADPLNLSPLSHMPYLFVANARRMLDCSGSEAGGEVCITADTTYYFVLDVHVFDIHKPA